MGVSPVVGRLVFGEGDFVPVAGYSEQPRATTFVATERTITVAREVDREAADVAGAGAEVNSEAPLFLWPAAREDEPKGLLEFDRVRAIPADPTEELFHVCVSCVRGVWGQLSPLTPRVS